jgi:phytoene dehydrogenase-like protein
VGEPDVGRAGTVHLGGSYAEIAATEREINTGGCPERPFVLVGQQYLADSQRSAGNIQPVYSYAHVPHGYDGDATEAIIAQIERFALGFRERIAGQVSSPASFAAANPNFEGGDIITGAKDARSSSSAPHYPRTEPRTAPPAPTRPPDVPGVAIALKTTDKSVSCITDRLLAATEQSPGGKKGNWIP